MSKLEEAALKHSREDASDGEVGYTSFIDGAKWQADQSKALEDALEFYSNNDAWGATLRPFVWVDDGKTMYQDPYSVPAIKDHGQIAREALKKYRESK